MADEHGFSIELKGLDQLIKALKTKPPVVRLGVLSSTDRSNKRGKGKPTTNAVVGAVHEFGAPGRNIPQRSFLRVPIMDNLNARMDKAGLVEKHALADVIKAGSIRPWVENVAVVAMGIVMEAFDTSGFGKWPAWKNPNYTNEGGQLLVDTQQLRDSISYEIGDAK